MPLHAVLTGNILNSTRLEPIIERELTKAIQDILRSHPFEFHRGDSFQAYLKDPRTALKLALLCRTTAISLTQDREWAPCDMRISIGLGDVREPPRKRPGAARGEAFALSGRSFDKMGDSTAGLAISTSNSLANAGLKVLADYANFIYEGMTVKQAEIIIGLLNGETQQDIAGEIGKSKSTVHQLASSGRWAEIQRLLRQFETLISHL
jgi:hypothetical protein